MSLSTRLLLVIATCLLPTLALQADAARRQWAERRAQLDAMTLQQVQLLAGNVGGIAEGARTLLATAAEFSQVRFQGESCGARLAGLRTLAPSYAFLAMVERDGRIRCASDDQLLAEAPDAPWIQEALAAREFAAGHFARPPGNPQGVLPFHMPLPAQSGQGAMALVAALDLNALERQLRHLKGLGNAFLEGGVLTVADTHGVILARDVRHAEFAGQRFPPAALPLVQASEPLVIRLRSIDGTVRLVGATPASYGLVSVVGLHEEELMADLKRNLRRNAVLLLVVSLFAVLLTLLVARRFITRPTEALLATARRWSRGELEARAPASQSGSEFGQLGAAYNEMAAALREREALLRGQAEALEVAVAERTRALTEANERLQAEIREHRGTGAALLQAQKVQAVGQLAGGIAHDFNNVLQAVTGGVALIRARAGDPAAVKRLAAMIEDSALRGESVTRRLLAFARREELRAAPLELAELMDGLREVLGATLGPRIRVQVAAAAGLPLVLADRGQLETVLVNLATNARDAMPEGGTVTLAAEATGSDGTDGLAPGSYVRLSVADTGEGMDAETLARASEPFFTTKPLGRGTGLGLAMARGFAQGSGGKLVIESTPGQGTLVALWLPLAPPVDAAEEAPAAAPSHRDPARILLVDDDPRVREVLGSQLEEIGHLVIQAANAEAALRLIEAGVPCDLLVTDLAMPGMDGISLIHEARHRRPGLAALLVTGFAGDAATLEFEAAGGAVLRKPVPSGELAQRVTGCLDATRRETSPALAG